jgi:hypothetical protein
MCYFMIFHDHYYDIGCKIVYIFIYIMDIQLYYVVSGVAMTIIMLLASLNSCTNPWIYLAFSGKVCVSRDIRRSKTRQWTTMTSYTENNGENRLRTYSTDPRHGRRSPSRSPARDDSSCRSGVASERL